MLGAALVFLFASANAFPLAAKDHKRMEYDAIVYHLKTHYQAKKVNLMVMWLARAVVSVAKPAGVKSFSLTVFQNLKFSQDTVDTEMQDVMRRSYGPEWSPIVHVRSHEGQQAYIYMREDGSDVRLVVVTIDKENAVVIRATFSPDKLVEFLNNPKILGISLGDDSDDKKPAADQAKTPDKK
jgi:hypothetical protein